MRILFVVPYVPNLVRVRPLNLIRFLNKANHKVTLLTLITEQSEKKDLKTLKEEGINVRAFPLPKWLSLWNTGKGLLSRDPLQSFYCWQPQLAKVLVEQTCLSDEDEKYDAIHIEHLRGVRFGLDLINRSKSWESRPPIIWDSVDCISHLFSQSSSHSHGLKSRLMSWIDLERTRRFESRIVGTFDRMLVTSPVDQKEFLQLSAAKEKTNTVQILPNGVDLEYFSYVDEGRDPYRLVVSGKMSYHANIAMVEFLITKIMPLVWQALPDIHLDVVGKDPSDQILKYRSDQRITISGTVSDIRPYLHKAAIAVAPVVYGAGIQNKILESMACGTPVVATQLAISALSQNVKQFVSTAEMPQQFADQIIALINSPSRRKEVARGGRNYVEMNHNWTKITNDLASIYTESAKI